MHAKDVHNSNFSLKNFTISIVKKISPQQIRREEFRFIEKYRTIQLGLNRYKPTWDFTRIFIVLIDHVSCCCDFIQTLNYLFIYNLGILLKMM